MAIDGVGVLAMDSGAGGMSDEAGRLVFSRDPSGTFIDGMVFGTSGGGENANLEVLCALPYELVRPHASASVLGPLVGVGNVKRLSLSVKYLDGEISVGRGTTVYPAFSLSRRAPSLVGMLSISSAPWSAAQESQNALICDPKPSRRCFLTTAIPSMMAACSAKASRICAAWTPLVPVRYMSVSATQRAGWMRAAPIRRSCPHTPMYVGLIVPSSCLTTAGTL